MSSSPYVRPRVSTPPAPAARRPTMPIPGSHSPQQPKVKHDPRAFAERVKLVAIGGTVAGFGVVWSLVAANVVGVTSRQATPAGGTGATGTTGANGVTAPQPNPSFFQGAGVQAPTFAGGTGETSGSGSLSGAGSSGSIGSSSHKLPTVGGFGGFSGFGPVVVSGSS